LLAVVPLVLALLLGLAGLVIAAEDNILAVVTAPRVPVIVWAEVVCILGAVGLLCGAVWLGYGLPDTLAAVPDLVLGAFALLLVPAPLSRLIASWVRWANLLELLGKVLLLAAEDLAALVIVAVRVLLVILAVLVGVLGTPLLLAPATRVLGQWLGAALLFIPVIVIVVLVVVVALALAMEAVPVLARLACLASLRKGGLRVSWSGGDRSDGHQGSEEEVGDDHGESESVWSLMGQSKRMF